MFRVDATDYGMQQNYLVHFFYDIQHLYKAIISTLLIIQGIIYIVTGFAILLEMQLLVCLYQDSCPWEIKTWVNQAAIEVQSLSNQH